MDFTTEQMEKAKNCKTLDEFKEMAKAEGFDLSEEEAKNCFSATRGGELSDDELSSVAGGGKQRRPEPKYAVKDVVRTFPGGEEHQILKRKWDGNRYKYFLRTYRQDGSELTHWFWEEEVSRFFPEIVRRG